MTDAAFLPMIWIMLVGISLQLGYIASLLGRKDK